MTANALHQRGWAGPRPALLPACTRTFLLTEKIVYLCFRYFEDYVFHGRAQKDVLINSAYNAGRLFCFADNGSRRKPAGGGLGCLGDKAERWRSERVSDPAKLFAGPSLLSAPASSLRTRVCTSPAKQQLPKNNKNNNRRVWFRLFGLLFRFQGKTGR